jgi:Tfp pilus assembly protein PilV
MISLAQVIGWCPASARSLRPATCRRGAILLEVLLALALLIAAGLTILGLVSQASASVERARDRALAIDLARSAMAEIEAGIANPETMSGPVEDQASDDATSGAPGPGAWGLEVETEPSQFAGLSIVRVRAIRYASAGSDVEDTSATLRQLVKLGGLGASGGQGAGDPAGSRDVETPPTNVEAPAPQPAGEPSQAPSSPRRPVRSRPATGGR